MLQTDTTVSEFGWIKVKTELILHMNELTFLNFSVKDLNAEENSNINPTNLSSSWQSNHKKWFIRETTASA